MSVTFVYLSGRDDDDESLSSSRSHSMPIVGLQHLRQQQQQQPQSVDSVQRVVDILNGWIDQHLDCTRDILGLYDARQKRVVAPAELIRDAEQYADSTLYVVTAKPTENSQSESQQQAPSSSTASSESGSAAAADPDSSVFSLRLPNQRHRQVYLSEMTDLVELRTFTKHISLEMLWSMIHNVILSESSRSGGVALQKEALLGMMHALIQHVDQQSPELLSHVQRTPTGAIIIPASVTASILRLHELASWDAAHLQTASASSAAPTVDQQQLIASLIFLVEGQTMDQLYLAFSLFTDDASDAVASSDSRDESLSRPQFLRFLRATLFPSVMTLAKQHSTATVLSWVESTTSFVTQNLTQLFDLTSAAAATPPRIGFAHLLHFLQAFPNILAFLSVAERIDARAGKQAAGSSEKSTSASSVPRVGVATQSSRSRRSRVNARQPLSPLHESPDESESDSPAPLDSSRNDDDVSADSDDSDLESSSPIATPDSPLFSFANSRQPSRAKEGSSDNAVEASHAPDAVSRAANATTSSSHPAVLVHPHTGAVLTLDPSHVQMVRSVYHALDHLSVSALLLQLQIFESNAELDAAGFDAALDEMLSLSPRAAEWQRQPTSRTAIAAHSRAIFDNFDVDRRGSVDVIELSVGLSIFCRGSHVEEKLRFAFHLLDSDSDGYITAEELADLFTAIMRPLMPGPDAEHHTFMKQLMDAFVPALFAQARAQDIDASEGHSEPEDAAEDSRRPATAAISYAEFRSMIATYTPRIDFLGIISRLLDSDSVLFGSGVKTAAVDATATTAATGTTAAADSDITHPAHKRKQWDKSGQVPIMARVASSSSEDESDEDGLTGSPLATSDEDISAHLSPAAEHRAYVTASRRRAAEESAASQLHHRFHKRPKPDPSSVPHPLHRDPNYQLGLFRHFKLQQDAIRALQQGGQPTESRTTRVPAAAPTPFDGTTPPFSSPSRTGPIAAGHAAAPDQRQPRAFDKWAAAVTPRKQPPGSSHRSSPVQSEPTSPMRGARPEQPITVQLIPNARDAATFPHTLEFTAADLARLDRLIRLLHSLQPPQPEYEFLSPAAVILKALEPTIVMADDSDEEADEDDSPTSPGTPLVDARHFHSGLSFLFSTAADLTDSDARRIDHLIDCCARAYDASSPSARSFTDASPVDVQSFLLAITVYCERSWSSAFQLVDSANSGRIDRSQLAQLFACCIRMLLGVHDGIRRRFASDPIGFRSLVTRIVSTSVGAFFPIADQDACGTITLRDFQRVRQRYPNLLPWIGLIQTIQKRSDVSTGPPATDERDDAANEATEEFSFDSSPSVEFDDAICDTSSDTSTESASPILSVDVWPTLPAAVRASFAGSESSAGGRHPQEVPLSLLESDIYHFLFTRSLAVTLDTHSLVQTVLLAERQECAGDVRGDLTHEQYHRVMALLFPVHLLPKAYHRLLSSILDQLFLVLSSRVGSKKKSPRVQTRHLILALHVLLPGSNESNLRDAWGYLVTSAGSTRAGCLRRSQFEELIACVLQLLISITSSCFHFTDHSLSLRAGVQKLVQRVAAEATELVFRLARARRAVRLVPAGDDPRRQVESITYGEFARIYAAHNTLLPWCEVLDGLIEGEEISKQQQHRVDDSAATAAMEADEADAQQSFVALSDSELEESDLGASSFGASPAASPPVSPTLFASESESDAPATVRLAVSPQRRDARRAFFNHWRDIASPTTKRKLDAHEAVLQRQERRSTRTSNTEQTTMKQPNFSVFVSTGSGSSSAATSRRSSITSSDAGRRPRARGQSARPPKKIYPQSLSVDPFSITMTTAQNPSPRAVLSAVETKPLPVFQLHSSAPKLLLCIPLHGDDTSRPTTSGRFGYASAIQSLKVYDSDMHALAFFKARLRRTDGAALLAAITDCAQQSVRAAGQDVPSHRLLVEARFTRFEFASALQDLLYGPASGGSDASSGLATPPPAPHHRQQLQSYTVSLFRMYDHESRGSVCALEILVGLSLLLDRTPEEKLRFAFQTIDAAHTGSLTQEEMMYFFRAIYYLLSALCSTHVRMSVPSQPGSPSAPTSGPLSPSSLHSLPHELVQARLESTCRFQCGELFRLGVTRGSRISIAQVETVARRHKHLFSFMHAIDLDKVFTPKPNEVEQAASTKENTNTSHADEPDEESHAVDEPTRRSSSLRLSLPTGVASAPMGSPRVFQPLSSPFDRTSAGTPLTVRLQLDGDSVVSTALGSSEFTVRVTCEDVALMSRLRTDARLNSFDHNQLFYLLMRHAEPIGDARDQDTRDTPTALSLSNFRRAYGEFLPLARLPAAGRRECAHTLDTLFLVLANQDGLSDREVSSHDRTLRVDVVELVVAIGSLARGTTEEKLRRAFDLLDTSRAGWLSRAEMFVLMRSVLAVLLTVATTTRGSHAASTRILAGIATQQAFNATQRCFEESARGDGQQQRDRQRRLHQTTTAEWGITFEAIERLVDASNQDGGGVAPWFGIFQCM